MLNSTRAISVANFIILSQLFCGLREIAPSKPLSVCRMSNIVPFETECYFLTKLHITYNSCATQEAVTNSV